MEDKTIHVKSCARCGEDHDNLTFTALLAPSAEWSHWAECPNTKEPVMMTVDDLTTQDKITKLLEGEEHIRAAYVVLVDQGKGNVFVYAKGGIGTIGLEEMERINEGLGELSNEVGIQTMYARNTVDSDKWRPMETEEGVCPQRRAEVGVGAGVFFLKDGKDYWRADDTCTYCGSLDPEKVIEILENGGTHERAKGYKGYVTAADGKVAHQKFYINHFTKEQVERLNELI